MTRLLLIATMFTAIGVACAIGGQINYAIAAGIHVLGVGVFVLAQRRWPSWNRRHNAALTRRIKWIEGTP